MTKYMCNRCDKNFSDTSPAKERECPECGSPGEEHSMLSMSELSDFAEASVHEDEQNT